MVKLLKGLYQVGGATLSHPWDGSTYLIVDRGEAALIDCGSHLGLEKLLGNIEGHGVSLDQVKLIIGTQGHFDHVEGVKHLKALKPGLRFALHRDDVETVETGDPERTCSGWLYNQTFHLPCQVDRVLQDGDVVRVGDLALKVLHLPGHCPGHIGIAAEITGLKVLFAGSTVHGAYGTRVGGDLKAWKKSLTRLLKVDTDLFTESHSNCVLYGDPEKRIQEALWRIENQYFSFGNPVFRQILYP